MFPTHSFDIFGPSDLRSTANTTVIVGTLTGTLYLNRPREVADYIDWFDHLKANAIEGHQAAELITRVRRDRYS